MPVHWRSVFFNSSFRRRTDGKNKKRLIFPPLDLDLVPPRGKKISRRLPLRLRLDNRRLHGRPGPHQGLCGRGLLLRDEQRRAVGHCVRRRSFFLCLIIFEFFSSISKKTFFDSKTQKLENSRKLKTAEATSRSPTASSAATGPGSSVGGRC